MNTHTSIGIDAGGTLIKVVLKDESGLRFRSIPLSEADACVSWLESDYPDAEIQLTGGKAALFEKALSGRSVHSIPEFAASCTGVRFLLKEQFGREPASFILTNVGTGTSIHFVSGEENRRIGGSGVGGGTIIGLSGLLTGTYDFSRMMKLSAGGRRQHVDLTVAHIYEGQTPPIPGNLTASNFGLVSPGGQEVSNADKLAAVIGLVAETVTTISVLAAEKEGADTVVYIGSSFAGNPLMKEVVESYSRFRGTVPVIPEKGPYSGAVGALLYAACEGALERGNH
ncbi:type II pantothenate kinase [Sporolactobacillus sp. THM7-7]|nr:type II pantothenate kinase [Sporolactobacillus sp. THM7-7]